MRNLTKLFEKAESMEVVDLIFWCDTLTPDVLLRLELHLRRVHLDNKADIVQAAGTANCGEEYDTVIEYA